MNALASFIMKGRSQAVLVIASLTILSWMLSLASLLAAAAVALPTLRRGGREGLILAACALPVVALAGQLVMGNGMLAGLYCLAIWAPVWLVAIVLRATASLPTAFMATLGLGILVVLGFYLVVSDPAAFWSSSLEATLKPMLEQRSGGNASEALISQTLQAFSRYATGAVAAGSMMTVMISLMIARWWQANLFNPGGFRTEFLQLRLPVKLSWAFLVVILAASVSTGGMTEFAVNLAVPFFMLYLLAGFAVIHAVCSAIQNGRFWLIGIYIGLMFIAPLVVVIVLVGLTDSWVDWRRRLIRGGV